MVCISTELGHYSRKAPGYPWKYHMRCSKEDSTAHFRVHCILIFQLCACCWWPFFCSSIGAAGLQVISELPQYVQRADIYVNRRPVRLFSTVFRLSPLNEASWGASGGACWDIYLSATLLALFTAHNLFSLAYVKQEWSQKRRELFIPSSLLECIGAGVEVPRPSTLFDF